MDFDFDLEPVAQARTRYTSRPYPHEYDPTEVKRFKRQVNAMATQKMQQLGLEPLDGALEVKMTAYRPIQKSVSKDQMRYVRQYFITRPLIKVADVFAKACKRLSRKE